MLYFILIIILIVICRNQIAHVLSFILSIFYGIYGGGLGHTYCKNIVKGESVELPSNSVFFIDGLNISFAYNDLIDDVMKKKLQGKENNPNISNTIRPRVVHGSNLSAIARMLRNYGNVKINIITKVATEIFKDADGKERFKYLQKHMGSLNDIINMSKDLPGVCFHVALYDVENDLSSNHTDKGCDDFLLLSLFNNCPSENKYLISNDNFRDFTSYNDEDDSANPIYKTLADKFTYYIIENGEYQIKDKRPPLNMHNYDFTKHIGINLGSSGINRDKINNLDCIGITIKPIEKMPKPFRPAGAYIPPGARMRRELVDKS